MINDCSLNSPKKRWKSDKASAGGRSRAPEDIPGAKNQDGARRGGAGSIGSSLPKRRQLAGSVRDGEVLPSTGACVCSSHLLH